VLKFLAGLIIALLATSIAAADFEDLPSLFAPRELRAGPVVFVPSFDCNLTYTDNAQRSEKNLRNDVINEYFPATAIRYHPSELISIDASYEFGWHDYAKGEERNYLSHLANFDLRLKNFKLRGLNLVFSEHYRQTGNSDPLENEVPSFQRFQTNTVSGKAEYESANFAISARVYYALADYFSPVFDVSDYQTVAGEIQGEYRLKPTHITIFGNYAEARTLHGVSDTGDYETHTLLVGAKGVYSKLDYSLAVGYTVADFINVNDHESGPSLRALLRYTPSPRLDFTVQAQRLFQPAANGGLTTETNVNFTARLKLLDRSQLLVGLTRNESDRLHDGRLISTEESLTYEYYLTRYASIRAGYAHIERNTTGGLPEFRINEARLGFHLAW
jgi:hypothetical protein